MMELAFDIGAERSKRETAMSNLVVLAREKAGADVMFRENIATRVEDSKPDQQLVEDNKNEIDTILTCLVYATTDRTITGEARDAVVELLIRNAHHQTLNWAERLIEQKGLYRLMEICSELEEYKYESAMPITPSSRTIASVCLARIYENMYYDEARQRFIAHIDEYIRDKLLNPEFESKVRVVVALTSFLLGPLDVGNTIFARDGIMQMILAMASDDELLHQKVASECLIAAASKKDKAKALIASSSGGLDASIRPFADGSTVKLAEACRRFLIKPGKDKDIRKFAAEGLSFLTLDADVKEKLIDDKLAIQALIELAKTGDQSVIYGVVTTLVNLVNAYEKQEMLPELMELAKFAKHHVPEESELDDPDFVAKRINTLAEEGTEKGKRNAGQALSRLGITINHEQAFPGQRSLEVVRPLLNQLHPDYSALENFEALLALCNLAQMNDSVRNRIMKEKGMSRIEMFLMEDHILLTRAATQVICNMVLNEDYIKWHEGDNDRVKFLALLCEEEDEETALACSGALAILTSNSAKCCEKMITPSSWLEILHTLIANPSPDVQFRGIVIIHNMIRQSKTVAEKIFDTDVLQLLMGVTQLNDEKRSKAIEEAKLCLKTAEDMKLIQEKKDDANDMMPDVFQQPQNEDLEEENE
ncbi:unnamed protein product [Chironomus riparius]|uniref:UNC-45/Cro1/She4 central domain-containing protein n=1 Tax=Chironomus riparius TaxID=315576 RepID=A0A9N9RXM2_9DIPT|nr:unnamed protein product [Chironomus riparius]CAG9804439.1 unnamed protein product [Chironomus riparius]